MSQQYGVIGHPIEQSLSPLIHSGWMKEHGLDAQYRAIDVAPGSFDTVLENLTQDGARGLNITAPHKQAALAAATHLSETAKRIGAANTLIRRGDDWYAENTDAPGFQHTLAAANIVAAGRRFALIGAGGAARGVVHALTQAGASVQIFNRTPSKAAALAADFPGVTSAAEVFDGQITTADGFDALINTASFGFEGARLVLPAGEGRLFYDISYGAAADPALKSARDTGWKAMDGLAMLVAQAAYSFEHWFGIFPDTTTALAKCRAAVETRT